MNFESISMIRITIESVTFREDKPCPAGAAWLDFDFARLARYCLDQPPTRVSTTIASNAASENHATLPWPLGSTMNAASSGPVADPVLPPTWKIDCAAPCCPPDAMRATRDDSG